MAEARALGLPAEKGRWGFIGLGFLANVCMGAVYAFSVFRKPLEALWEIPPSQVGQLGYPFMVFLAVFALGMALAGGLVENWGPRKTGILGGLLVGLGWILAGFSSNVGMLTLFYGVIGGAGVGIAYGCPIAVAGKWFSDRRGLAVGLTLAGFGASALVVAPIMGALIDSQGPLRTFTIMGVAFLVVMVLAALPMAFPPQGGKVASPKGKAKTSALDVDRGQMVRTPTFWSLWGVYTMGCLAGLMAIGIAAPFGQEVANLSAGLAAVAVSVFAVFNGVGRPLFGWLTDRLTPRYAGTLSFTLIFLAALLLWRAGGSQIAYFVGFSILWLNLGGWLAIAPAATATLFGTQHYAKNYGLVFTSYGVGAILGNVMSGLLRDLTSSYVAVFPPVMALAVAGIVVALVGFRLPVRSNVPVTKGK